MAVNTGFGIGGNGNRVGCQAGLLASSRNLHPLNEYQACKEQQAKNSNNELFCFETHICRAVFFDCEYALLLVGHSGFPDSQTNKNKGCQDSDIDTDFWFACYLS